jgi:predicted transcriptional regulator
MPKIIEPNQRAITISASVPPAIVKRLEAEAARQVRSKSNILVIALSEYLKQCEDAAQVSQAA